MSELFFNRSRRGDSFVRSQAMMIGAKLISPEGGVPSLVSKEGMRLFLSIWCIYCKTGIRNANVISVDPTFEFPVIP